MNVYEKLQSARVQLQNKKLKKSGKNKFAGFEYFELSDFLPIINEIFAQQKLFSLFKISDSIATLSVINAEKPDEVIGFETPIAELELKDCNAIQALGGVNTYCKRYLYLNALEIVEADLFDSTSGQVTEKPKTKEPVKKTDSKPKQAAKPENKESDINADFDIITGLDAIEDVENLRKYYSENKSKIKDETAFLSACKARKEVLGQKEAANIY